MEVPTPTVRPKLAKPDPKNPITSPEAGMRVSPQRDLKLMPENKVLEREIPTQPSSEKRRYGERGARLRASVRITTL